MKSAVIGMVFIIYSGLSAAWGQAVLPTSHSGPWNATPSPLPAGWTQNKMGTDYKTDYDGSGGNAGKFDDGGDWLQIQFGQSPSAVSYYAMGNSLSGDYIYKVQESTDGSTWTDVVVFNPANPLNNSKAEPYTNGLLSASRYVRFIYVTKVGGNVGLDGVRIEGTGIPVVTFSPSGAQSIAVSNLLSLAVSIAPSGSGMQGWSLTPVYAGAASLSGGNFSFTPAGGDSGKTFTLSVVGTNSIGSSTGKVSISVTAYVPPVPVVTFSPTGTYSIMATTTQKLGVGVAPAGSGISGWSLVPSNYSGTATLVGTNFTFVTAQGDGPSNYTLSVVATNVHGIRTGTAEIAVTTYIPLPPPGSVVVDFEDAPNKTSYSLETNNLSGRSWLIGGATSQNAGDKKFDQIPFRIRCDTTDNPIKLCSRTPFASGIESISLWYAIYGTDGTNKAPEVSIQISTNLDTGWVTLDTFDSGSATNLVYLSCPVRIKEPVYFRLWSPYSGSDSRANIDNITIAPFVVHTGYNAYLLQYNATPGDPGTAEGDDLDGDGFTNLQEYNAVPKTNPYDEASHP